MNSLSANLTTAPSDSYEFSLLQSFGFEGKTYLLAMSENCPGQIFIVENKGHELSLVTEDTKLEQLKQHLETLKDTWQTLTVSDDQGKQHVFQVARRLEHQGESYLIGVNYEDGVELAVFKIQGEGYEIESNEAVVVALLNRMKAHTSSVMTLTMETQPGQSSELIVVGQLEIEGKLYILAATEESESELIAFVQDGDELKPIETEAEQALIQQHLQQLATPV